MTAPAPVEPAPRIGDAAEAPAAAATPSSSTTPGRAIARARVWIIAAVGSLVAVVLVGLLQAAVTRVASPPLDIDGAGQSGARAVVQVLREQGVDVRPAASIGDVESLVASAHDAGRATTVVVHDRGGALQSLASGSDPSPTAAGDEDRATIDDAVRAARSAGVSRIVLLEARPALLAAFADGRIESAGMGGAEAATLDAGDRCPAEFATTAKRITSERGPRYDVVDGGGVCFTTSPTGNGALAVADVDGIEVVALGSGGVLSNARVDQADNAALALSLLGSTGQLVWWVPDIPATADSFVPEWLSIAIALLLLAAVALMIARGRRFGPLVAERLPVVVPAGETIEGRARLYARSDDVGHALDALRVGTLGRLARLLGLSRTTPADVVVDQTASVLGVQPAQLRPLLLDARIGHARELVDLGERLLRVEQDCAAALGYEWTPGLARRRARPPASEPASGPPTPAPSSARAEPAPGAEPTTPATSARRRDRRTNQEQHTS